MNLVMICRLYAPHIGGVEKHVAGVAAEAIKEGHRVEVFTLKHDQKLPTDETIERVKVHRLSSLLLPGPLKGHSPGALSKFLERVALYSWMIWHIKTFIVADVTQIHDVFYWYWPIRIILPWKKVFITFHGFEAGSLPTLKTKRTRQMIQRWTQGSMAVGSWIEKWYGTRGDSITYGAGECNRQKYNSRLRSNSKQQVVSSKGKLSCVFIGRIADDTGAKVYEQVISKLPNVTLDMYGAGSKLGTVDDTCVVFPQYDVACVSSYLAIIEAMQCRTLVVAFAAHELKYEYLVAHPRAADMIIVSTAEELESFFQNYSPEKYKSKVESAYTWARQQTWNRVYLKYRKLWREQ